MTSKFWVIVPGLLFLAGCTFPVRRQVDELICERGELGYDLQPVKQEKAGKKENMQEGRNSPRSGDVQQAGFFLIPPQEAKQPVDLFLKRLKVPPEVPGSDAPDT